MIPVANPHLATPGTAPPPQANLEGTHTRGQGGSYNLSSNTVSGSLS